MEPLFKNITKYNQKNYQQFAEFHNKKNSFSYNLYTIIMTLLLIYCIILNIAQKNISFLLIFLGILILFLLFRIYIPARRHQKTHENYSDNKQNAITFNFYKHYFTVGKKTIYYLKLFKVFETNDYFYLYVSDDYAALVDKKGFEIGNSSDFSNFIKKKCLLKYSKQL